MTLDERIDNLRELLSEPDTFLITVSEWPGCAVHAANVYHAISFREPNAGGLRVFPGKAEDEIAEFRESFPGWIESEAILIEGEP